MERNLSDPSKFGSGLPADRPRIYSFGHLSMPVRDIEQSKRFFIEVMGGEPMSTSDPETFTEVRVAGAVVGLSTRGGVPTGRAMSNIRITRFTRTRRISCR